jgi:hypothetical protein
MKAWKSQAGGRGPSAHWDWNDKRRNAAAKAANVAFIALASDGECHGMMLLLWPRFTRLQADASLVYVDYLEVAPKHRHGPAASRDLLGVGKALIEIAILLSCAEGLEGRIGLHSLKGAEKFYLARGLTPGDRDKEMENLLYFELVGDGESFCP